MAEPPKWLVIAMNSVIVRDEKHLHAARRDAILSSRDSLLNQGASSSCRLFSKFVKLRGCLPILVLWYST